MYPDDLPRAFIVQLPIDSLVPLADQSGEISCLPKQIRERLSARLDQGAGKIGQVAARSQPGAPHIPAGQQAVAGGDAVGSRGMGVGENQAFSCQPVQVGRGDSAVAVEDGDIAITHVAKKLVSSNVFLNLWPPDTMHSPYAHSCWVV